MRVFLTARVFSGVHALSNSPKNGAHPTWLLQPAAATNVEGQHGAGRRLLRAAVPDTTLTELTNAHVDNAGRRLYDRCVHFAERLREFALGTMRLEPAFGRLVALD